MLFSSITRQLNCACRALTVLVGCTAFAPSIFAVELSTATATVGDDGWAIVLVGWALVVLLGMVAGWRGRVVVYRNFNDLALVFGAGMGLLAAFFTIVFFTPDEHTGMKVIVVAFLVASGFCLLATLWRTWMDTRSVLWFPVVLVTKLSLAVLFLVNLVELIRPSGDTQVKRASSRASALGFLVILTPLVLHLVRDKTGIWTPSSLLSAYHQRRMGV